MAVDPERIRELRDTAADQAGRALSEAERHRGLASAAPDDQTRQAHERGAASYVELARQHQAVAAQRQTELVEAERIKADEIARMQAIEAERQREADRARQERDAMLNSDEYKKFEADLERYRQTRDRTRDRFNGLEP